MSTEIVRNPWDLIVREQEKGTSIEQLKEAFDLYERWLKLEAEKAWNRAMTNCQRDMPSLVKDSKNKHTGNWYTSYEQLDRQIRPVYLREGFSLCFTEIEQERPEICRMALDVLHVDGHVRRFQKDVHIDGVGIKGNPNMTPTQADGSTSAYAKRYVTKNTFNLVETGEDVDGDAGNHPITAGQLKELEDLVATIAINRGRPLHLESFLKFLEVETLAELPQWKFESAKQELVKKSEEKPKEKK